MEGPTDNLYQLAALQEAEELNLGSIGQFLWEVLILQRSNKNPSHILRQIFLVCKI